MWKWITTEQLLMVAGICFATAIIIKLLVAICEDKVRWIITSIAIGVIIAIKFNFVSPPTKTTTPQTETANTSIASPIDTVKESKKTNCFSINNKDMDCLK